MKICHVDNCGQPSHCKGLCRNHYWIMRRNGSPYNRQAREKGTGSFDKDGYHRIEIKGKTYKTHRLIMEQHLGRKLHRDELVHHKNGIRTDNRLSNLEIMNASKHGKHHHPAGKPRPDKFTGSHKWCPRCEKMYPIDNFYKDSHVITGLSCYCKSCCKSKTKNYKLSHVKNYIAT